MFGLSSFYSHLSFFYKNTLFFIALIFWSGSTFGQCSLLAHYPLNGNAGDSSGFANHGTVYGGAAPAVDRFNQANGAMYFDGANDYINTFSTFDIPFRTVSIWFYPERSVGLNQIFTHDAISLTYGSFGSRVSNGTLLAGTAGNSTQLLSSVPLNQWYHLVLVSRPDSGFCYINGVEVAAETSTSNGSSSGAYNKLVIAVGRQRNQKFYQGRVDDLQVFDCAFNPVQVDSIFVSQAPFPPLVSYALDTTLCLGDSLYFNLDGRSNIDYFWDNGSTDTLRKITNAGTYTLRQIRGGDTLVDTIQLNLRTPFVPTFLDTAICNGDSLLLDYSNNDIDSILWFDGISTKGRTFSTAGTFTFTVYQEPCGSFVDFVTISLDTLLNPIVRDTSSCQASLLIGQRLNPSLSYQWSNGLNTPQIQVNQAGVYTLRVSGSCNAVTDTFKVNFPVELPDPSPLETFNICESNDSVLIGISINPLLSFSWSNGAGATEQWVNSAAEYRLKVYNECDTVENIYQVYYDSIIQPAAIPDTIVCKLNSIDFDLNFEEVQEVSVNGRLLFNNQLIISEPGIYEIEYIQECGSAFDSFSLSRVSCECNFLMPNAFTPNGDGLNDRFRIENQCEDLVHSIQIFNRWGVLVFENKSSTDFWDGTYKGEAAKGGVYLYKLQYKGQINGLPYEGSKEGYLSLVR